MSSHTYKGYDLSAAPYQLRDTGRWVANVTITKHFDSSDETIERQFPANSDYELKSDAVAASLRLGQTVIDDGNLDF
jgi:hypothetical protein